MNYRVMKQHTFERVDALELHLLARAYYAAWKRVHDSEPIHEHAIPSLNLLIYFDPVKPRAVPVRAREARGE
mgnify:CR=1 FL=1